MKRMDVIRKRWSMDQLITGIELPAWTHVLQDNRFRVAAPYLHRAALVSALSIPATVLGRLEDARYGRRLAAMAIDPEPIFVLGHWRSGTTHLHNLLGRAPEHTFPTVLQVVLPGAFLSAGEALASATSGLFDDTRSYDNVRHGWHEAAEDEIALAKLTGLSPYLAFMFPDHAARYERYVDFAEATGGERERWQEALRFFVKKVMLQTGGRRVVLKSCPHTARLRLLLETFPRAQFVYIHRHPYEVLASTLHMRSHTDWENFFQVPWANWEEQRLRQTLLLGERILERYLEDRRLVPPHNLVELAYHELCGNELHVLGELWARLGLPGWASAEPVLRGYVDGLRGYQRNTLAITDEQKALTRLHWHAAFDAFGYGEEVPP